MRKLLLCDCAGTQKIDKEGISQACGVPCSKVATSLCTDQIEIAAQAMEEGDVLIACQQERAVFEDLGEELGVADPAFVDLRDRAGWNKDGDAAAPKMSALVAEALVPSDPVPTVDVTSTGTCLIVGPSAVAFQLAEQVSDALAVTVLCLDGDLPDGRGFDVIQGRLARVTGAFGGFEVKIDAFRQLRPGGRGAFTFTQPQDGATSYCDIVIDLAGDVPFVSAPEKREGYLRADPKDLVSVQALAARAVQMVGTFEKPLFVSLSETLCAHSRAGKSACSNCLNICPTGAITSNGDSVAIDPMICAGCGACAALCPSGAITYEDPPVSFVVRRFEALANTFRKASGGRGPRLLVHDAHGAEMIRICARYADGLPLDVIPFELPVVSGFGHAEMLAALAQGFASVDILPGPKSELDALNREVALAEAIAGSGRVQILDIEDPAELTNGLAGTAAMAIDAPVLPLGNRRQIARLSAQALHPGSQEAIVLPEGAPYGAVLVDSDACTLCLACVSLCPPGALVDNPDRPELRFQEDACLQCGLCSNVCPENAITYEPRLNLSEAALSQVVLNEEDPFACIECGTEFGVKSTVERIVAKLSGAHPMFENSDQTRLIQMCDNCRIQAQYHSENNPFSGEPRPKPRTTEDYFSDRKDH